ncbi:hypothetical protein [Pseudomonas sp. NPDC087690]|uniref:hypothetical protein n=1 Tax=Pseudomonas sp. NPDC087690 TaxID=3364446 RepID=UPI001F143FD3
MFSVIPSQRRIFYSCLIRALAYQGIFVVAWVGVALAQILYGRNDVATLEEVATFNPAGLTAWFGATALGLALILAGAGLSSFSAPSTVLVAFPLQVDPDAFWREGFLCKRRMCYGA